MFATLQAKLIAAAILLSLGIIIGWHSQTVYNAYLLQKDEVKVIKKLGEGQANIIDFNQKFDKEKNVAKDDCINATIPAGIVGLLH